MKKLSVILSVIILAMLLSVGASAEDPRTGSVILVTTATNKEKEENVTDETSNTFSLPELTNASLTVSQASVPTVKAGEKGTVNFTLENIAFGFATDITVQYKSESSDIVIDPKDSIASLSSVSVYSKTPLSVPVTVSPKASGLYNISVTVSCKSSTDYFTQTTNTFSGTISVYVSEGERIQQPVIKDMKFSNAKIVAGDENTLSFTVYNPNSFALSNISMVLDGFKDGYVDDADPDRELYIETLGGGESKTFTVKAVTSYDIVPEIYNFTLNLTAEDSFGEEYTSTKSTYFVVKEKAAEDKKPDEFTEYSPRLIIDSFNMKPTSAQPGDTVTLELNVINLGALDAENVKITLSGYSAETITLREVTAEKNVEKIVYGTKSLITYSMTLSSVFPQDTNVPLTVSFAYDDISGKYYEDSTVINIVSISPKKQEEQEKPEWVAPVYKTPKIIIESFDCGSDYINAGEEFNLTFTLKNTSADLDVENIKVLMVSSASGTADVFTPVNSGYSFYLDKIEKLGETTLTIPLLAKVSAESGIYALNFNIEYQYYVQETEKSGDYRNGNGTETISLKVVQPINIEVTNFYTDYSIASGETGYISFSYNNKSRSNLYFMNIDIEGDVQFTEGKQEIGSIPSGYSDYFDGTIIATGEPGEAQCNLVFTFKDSLNKETQIKYPFTVTISEPYIYEEPTWSEEGYYGDEYGYEEPIEETGMNILGIPAWIVFTVGGVIVAAIVIIIIVVVKKKKAVDE